LVPGQAAKLARRLFGLSLALLSVSISLAGARSANQASDPQASGSQQPLQSTTELVKVDVSVADAKGAFVSGLAQQDFRVLDNGLAQPVTFFAPVEAPARILVMIETGPAVYLMQGDHLAAAYALLEGLHPDDEVALVSYDREAHQVLPFTPDKIALLNALGRIQYNIGIGDLNFYDSLSTVIGWLKHIPGKRAIVLLGTGLDSTSPDHWDALVAKLRREDIVVFPIALGGSLRGYSGKTPKRDGDIPRGNGAVSFAKADRALQSLATITGGRAHFPQSGGDFQSVYRDIASALRHQYVLGFAPAHDGAYHPLTIQVVAREGRPSRIPKAAYRISAREGYVAPAQ
jgi:VWFA-related protein